MSTLITVGRLWLFSYTIITVGSLSVSLDLEFPLLPPGVLKDVVSPLILGIQVALLRIHQ